MSEQLSETGYDAGLGSRLPYVKPELILISSNDADGKLAYAAAEFIYPLGSQAGPS